MSYISSKREKQKGQVNFSVVTLKMNGMSSFYCKNATLQFAKTKKVTKEVDHKQQPATPENIFLPSAVFHSRN